MVPVQSLSVHKLCEPHVPTELGTQLQREKQICLRKRYGDILSLLYLKQSWTLLLVSDSAFSFAAERRRSKKCSIFDTISENVVTSKEAEKYQQQSVENITIPKIRKENAKYFYSLKRQLTLILNVELTTQCSWNYIWHFIEVLKESVHSRESQLWL